MIIPGIKLVGWQEQTAHPPHVTSQYKTEFHILYKKGEETLLNAECTVGTHFLVNALAPQNRNKIWKKSDFYKEKPYSTSEHLIPFISELHKCSKQVIFFSQYFKMTLGLSVRLLCRCGLSDPSLLVKEHLSGC